MKTRRYRRWAVPALALFLICVAALWLSISALATHNQDTLGQAAQSYAGSHMIWNSGPNVQSEHVVPLRQLAYALAAYVPKPARNDVNVADLIRRYGPSRQVGVVVLRGAFNSLAPDEGVTATTAVAIVDARSNKVLILTD